MVSCHPNVKLFSRALHMQFLLNVSIVQSLVNRCLHQTTNVCIQCTVHGQYFGRPTQCTAFVLAAMEHINVLQNCLCIWKEGSMNTAYHPSGVKHVSLAFQTMLILTFPFEAFKDERNRKTLVSSLEFWKLGCSWLEDHVYESSTVQKGKGCKLSWMARGHKSEGLL